MTIEIQPENMPSETIPKTSSKATSINEVHPIPEASHTTSSRKSLFKPFKLSPQTSKRASQTSQSHTASPSMTNGNLDATNNSLSPEQVNLYNLLAYFKAIVERLYRNHLGSQGVPIPKASTFTVSRPFVTVIPVWVNGGEVFIDARFFDGHSWAIFCCEETTSDAIVPQESSFAPPETSTQIVGTIPLSNEGSETTLAETLQDETVLSDVTESSNVESVKGKGVLIETAAPASTANNPTKTACKPEMANEDFHKAVLTTETLPPFANSNSQESHIEQGLVGSSKSLVHHGGNTQPSQVQSTTHSQPADSIMPASPTLLTATIEASSSEKPAPVLSEHLIHFLRRIIIQRHLKTTIQLPCIPEIPACEFVPTIVDNVVRTKGLNWIIEENPLGSPVKLSRSTTRGSDKILILVNNEWISLSGRKKERLLDDLAHIQVAYSTLGLANLGPVVLQYSVDPMEGISPKFRIGENSGTIFADVRPSKMLPADYMQSYPVNAPPFLAHLASAAIPRIKPIPGPYPLQPPSPIWPHLLINPETGNITCMRNSFHAESVPWEIASRPPLQLSPRSQARYAYSLKRHFFSTVLRARDLPYDIPMDPRLDELAFSPHLEIIDLIVRMREISSKEELDVLERRMVVLVLGLKDYKKCKANWERRERGWG